MPSFQQGRSARQDSIDEADETFSLSLSQATYPNGSSLTISDYSGVATILNDDTSGGGGDISVSVNDVSVTEGGSAAFKISLSSVSTQDVSVSYGTSNGTAGGSDYSSTWSYAVIPAGSISTTVYIETTQDSIDEADETFSLSLSQATYPNGSSLTISDYSGVATILDDDTTGPTNEAPLAVADSYELDEDSTLIIQAPGLLTNDTDPDGDLLSAVLVTGVAHGVLTIAANGSFNYQPNPNFHGTDSFSYRASDGQALSALTTVSIVVHPVEEGPVSLNDIYWLSEDGVLTTDSPGLLANDTDSEGLPISVATVTQPSHGLLTWNADGSFVYTPEANFFGIDSFTYRATNGSFLSPVMTVTIYVAGVNDTPVGQVDNYTLNENGTLQVAAPGLIGNDQDLDGRSLTAEVVTQPTHGTLTVQANGTFTYVPTAHYYGTDSFTYQISNGILTSVPITVNLTINEFHPEVVIEENGVALTDGVGEFDFGDTPIGTPLARTFTIRNTGNAPLSLSAESLVAPLGYSLTESLPETLNTGASVTFTLTLTAAVAGVYGGAIALASNDRDEADYDIAVTGRVLGAEVRVESEDGTEIVDNAGSLNFGSTSPGNPIVRALTIRNTGTTPLTLDPQSLIVPAGFTVITPFVGTVAAGASTTLLFKLNASSVGDYSGTLSFTTNDPSETTYNFAVSGVVSGAVLAAVEGLSLVSDTGLSATDRHTKDARLTGTVEGLFLGNVRVEFDHDGDGTKEEEVSVYLPGTPFVYTPEHADPSLLTYEGQVDFRYRIVQQDTHGNTLGISGWASVDTFWLEHPLDAEIAVSDSQNNEILDNFGFVDFGTADRGAPVTKTITISNDGLGELQLNLQSLSVPAGFTIVTPPAATISAGGSSSLILRLDATTVGSYDGQLSLLTNDDDEHVFNFRIAGEVVVRVAEIEVRSQANLPLLNAGTFAFGATAVGQPIDRTFTIRNTGNVDLTLDLANSVLPAGFSLLTSPSATVAPGQQSNFIIRFAAGALGSANGVFSLLSNDADEASFDLTLSASAVAVGDSSIGIDGPRLLNDNGSSATDLISDDIRITGVVNGYLAGGAVRIEFDHSPDLGTPNVGNADGSVMVTSSGNSFVYDPISVDGSLATLNGPTTFRYRTVHLDASNSVVSSSNWTDFAFERTAPVGSGNLTVWAIGLRHDTGSSSTDLVTVNPTLYAVLQGSLGNSSGSIEFDHNGDHIADGSLNFAVSGDELYYDPRATDSSIIPSSQPYTLHYRLVQRNEAGFVEASGSWQSFTYTLEALPTTAAVVSGVYVLAGDEEYEFPTIQGTVVGGGTASAVEWSVDGDTTPEGSVIATNGSFAFSPTLTGGYGTKTIKVRAKTWSDAYGTFLVSSSWTDVNVLWNRVGAATISNLKLALNTGSTTDTSSLDPTISGKIVGGKAGVKVYFDFDGNGTPEGSTVSDEGGDFTYRQLGLQAGYHTVTVWAARWDVIDEEEVAGPTTQFSFTLEVAALPAIAELKLALDDGSSTTDHITAKPQIVGRIGETTTIATDVDYEVVNAATPSILLTSGRAQVDSTGAFTFTPVGLATDASYLVRSRTVRWNSLTGSYNYGSWSAPQLSFTLAAAQHIPAELADLVLVRPANGTGETTEPAVKGTVRSTAGSSSPAAYMVVEVAIDTAANTQPTAQAQVVTDAHGNFTYVPIGLTNGSHVLHFRTREWNYATRTAYYGAWQAVPFTLVSKTTTAPVVSSLSLHSDTGSSQSDNVTANPLLIGQVAGLIANKTVVEIDIDGVLDGSGNQTAEALAYPDSQGAFRYRPEPLAYGAHTVYARAVAWDDISGSFIHSNAWTPITFTYEMQANVPAIVTSIGSSVAGGKSVISGHVINGEDLANIVVQFNFDADQNTVEYTAVTDAQGRFSIEPVGVAYGTLAFEVRTRELDSSGGQLLSSTWGSVNLNYSAPPDVVASVSTLQLANDTGENTTDGQTTDSTLIGTIANDGAVGSLLVQFITMPMKSQMTMRAPTLMAGLCMLR